MSKGPESSRNPDRTRETILNAAESLFAQQGYEATSLQQIGKVAGVSRGTPGYFFGSKEQLYQAVLDRILKYERETISQALLSQVTDGGTLQELLTVAIVSYHDFLAQNPNFVRLLEREALSDGQRLKELESYLSALQNGLRVMKQGNSSNIRQVDPAQLLLSIIALCWFPQAHATTFLQAMGMDASDPAFIEQRKQHVIDLVLHGILKT